MHDQSLDRVNGRSMAAFATICERKLNMVSVLKSAGEFAGEFVDRSGMRRSLIIRQESGTNNFRGGPSFPSPIGVLVFFHPRQKDRKLFPQTRILKGEGESGGSNPPHPA